MERTELIFKIAEFAKANKMEWTWHKTEFPSPGDWCIKVSYFVSINYGRETIKRMEILHVRENGDGLANYWFETNHDGRCHISGPGYHGGYIGEQKRIPLKGIYYSFLARLKDSVRYYDIV